LVFPFNVGSPPEIDFEVRYDNTTSYHTYVYDDITAGYNFTETDVADWDTANANYHVVTQVHNTDTEDGKPFIYQWAISNPDGLTYQFYYENVTRITDEALSFTAYSGTLAQDFVQQDSLVLKRSDGSILVQGTDYEVNWTSGTVTGTLSQSLSAAENVTANYFYYDYMDVGDDPTDLSTSQWTTLGTAINTANIDLNVTDGTRLTTKQDFNTIRFKQRA